MLASRTDERSGLPKGFRKLLLLVPLLGNPQVEQTGASIRKLSGTMFITTQRHNLQRQVMESGLMSFPKHFEEGRTMMGLQGCVF